MSINECINVINSINIFLNKNMWIDFEICRLNGGQIVLSGKLDEMDEELIEISFLQPFMISSLMNFSYEKGVFITLLQGDEAIEMNRKYNVVKGNHIFKLFVDNNEEDFFVIAKEIHVNIANL